jgi:TetR/AcrR family transcriptional repressor of uid operon
MTDTWAPARRRGRPPASDSALTRERILQAAQKVFAEFGYEAATFQAIAAEIGLTRPAINNYFSSKAALYGEVVYRVSHIVRDAIGVASKAPTLADQILTFIRVAFRAEGRDPSLAAFLVQAGMDVQHLPGGDCQAANLVERFVRIAVASAVRRGEVSDGAEGLTDMLMGLVWGAAFQIGRGNSERADRMFEQLCGMLDQGLVR